MPAQLTRLAWLPLLVAAGVAQAGRPLMSEDAGVIERSDCELEGVHARPRAVGITTRATSLQLGCGIGFMTQIGLKTVRSRSAGRPGAQGVELNGKTQLARWGEADDATQLAIAWSVAGEKPSGQGLRHAGSSVNLALSTPAGGIGTLHVNLGHARDAQARQGSTTWSLAFEHEGLGEDKRWQPMVELFGNDRDKQPFVNAALRYAVVPDTVFVDGSAGRQMAGAKARLYTLGFRFAF